MGQRGSKVITYREAASRFEPDEVETLRDGFKAICARGKPQKPPPGYKGPPIYGFNRMDKMTFIGEVFGPTFPHGIASRMFHCFSLKGRDFVSWKEFLVGLAIVLKGTDDEKVRFLFWIYDIKNEGLVSREQMESIMKDDVIDASKPLGEILDKLFQEASVEDEGKVRFQQIKTWALENKNLTALTSWLFDENKKVSFGAPPKKKAKEKENKKEKDEKEQHKQDEARARLTASLAMTMLINDKGVPELKQMYDMLVEEGTSMGEVDEQTLAKTFPSQLPKLLLTRMFNLFDTAKVGRINIRQFVCALSSCWGGDLNEKLEFCFKIYDSDEDGKLSRDEMLEMVRSIWKVKDLQQLNPSFIEESNSKSTEEKSKAESESQEKSDLKGELKERLDGTKDSGTNDKIERKAKQKIPSLH